MGSRVLIVGGGIAGLSAAIALRRSGADVDVVELDRRWAVDDIGMIVHANFARAMNALGVAGDVTALGIPSAGASLEDFAGRPLVHVDDVRIQGRDYPHDLGISRVALHKLLASAALAAGAQVRLGVTFKEIVQLEDRVAVTLTDDSVGNYDLVVGADGVHSGVRSAVFGPELRPQLTGHNRWRCKVRRPKDLVQPFVRVKEDGTRLGYMPITARSASVMLLDSEPVESDCPAARLPEIFRARLGECTGRLAQLREQIVDPDKIVYRPIEVLFMPGPWYRGRVLLIGDASHALTAHMAQGAVQAVEDGVVLGDLFARNPQVPALLEAFMHRRYERCKLIAETTLLVEQSDRLSLSAPHIARMTQRMLEVASSPF